MLSFRSRSNGRASVYMQEILEEDADDGSSNDEDEDHTVSARYYSRRNLVLAAHDKRNSGERDRRRNMRISIEGLRGSVHQGRGQR